MQIEELPLEIQNTVAHFATRSTEQRAARQAWQDALSDLAAQIASAAEAVAQAEEDYPENPEKVAPFREKLRRLKQQRANTKAPAFNDFLPVVEAHVSAAKALKPVTVEADIRKGETPLAAFNRLTAITDAIIREVEGVKTAPPSDAEIQANLAAQLKAMAKPPHIDSRGNLELPKVAVTFTAQGPQMGVDVLGVLTWAFRDALTQAVAKLPLPGVGMSAAERREKLTTLYANVVAALRVEAATATAAEKAGQMVVRRRHVAPAILIGAAVDPAAAYEFLATRRGT